MCHYKFCINFYKFYILDNIYLFGHMKNSKRHKDFHKTCNHQIW